MPRQGAFTWKERDVLLISGALLLISLFFNACATGKENSLEASLYNKTNDLIPYINDDLLFGYCDKKTHEIAIPAQYRRVYPFIGDYAVVETTEEKYIIIDKNNNRLLKNYNFDRGYLFSSEDKRTVLALTDKWKGLKINPMAIFAKLVPVTAPVEIPDLFEHTRSDYRIYNLTTGKLVTKKLEDFSRVYVVGNYLAADTYLYQFLDNGNLKYAGNDRTVQILNEIIKQRGIDLYEFYLNPNDQRLEYKYLKYEEDKGDRRPDLEKLQKVIPDGFEYKPFMYPYRFNNGRILSPVYIKRDDIYRIELEPKNGTNTRTYGVYNDTQGTWLIDPVGSAEPDARNLEPTNDENVWYGTDGSPLYWIYDIENKIKYSPREFQVYRNINSSGDHLGIYYPGVQYVYTGYYNDSLNPRYNLIPH
jgi:hypothetical protein